MPKFRITTDDGEDILEEALDFDGEEAAAQDA